MLKPKKGSFAGLAAVVLGSALFGMNAVDTRAQSDTAAKPETVEARTITVRIDRPFATVSDFLANPTNWNQWAFGLGKNIRQSTDGWIADSGEAQRMFASRRGITLAWWIIRSFGLPASASIFPCD